MNVRLINHSGGNDMLETIAYIARVSNPSSQKAGENSEKLIKYLIEHQHWSPLEMVSICLEVDTTRDIARQILRHRSFSFQEFSQRYSTVNHLGGSEFRQARTQDDKNRQNSFETDDQMLQLKWQTIQEKAASTSRALYDQAIGLGIAKEQARAVLPEGLTPSRLYIAGTLRSWIHYIQVRTDPSTQKEHRDVAVACATAIEKVFPMIMEFVK
jgi:thymidylate synthase (FAD)